MSSKCELSDVSIRYLSRYYEILEEMMRAMINAEEGCSISGDFIRKMIPHHEAAIKMSENLLLYTTNVPLQKIAQNIIEEQTKGIEKMKDILLSCDECENTKNELYVYRARNEVIIKNMFYHMQRAFADNDINLDFIREMIPHHKGAIEMSRNALYFPVCDGLKPILENIITTRTQGICEMESVMKCIGK